MISREGLAEISRGTDLHLYQQEKDYLLKLFLYFYYRRFDSAAFKGGTCLKYLLGLNRFSEDLDFETRAPVKFRKEADGVLEDIRSVGIEAAYLKREKFRKSYTCQISFHGPLYTGSKRTRNKFTIDAGRRTKMIEKPEWNFIESEYPETGRKFLVYSMNPKEILAEKVAAMLERNKGRDLYDVWFMLKNGYEIDGKILAKKYGKKIRPEKITGKSDYERDLKRLTHMMVPYEQVAGEVRKKLNALKNNI